MYNKYYWKNLTFKKVLILVYNFSLLYLLKRHMDLVFVFLGLNVVLLCDTPDPDSNNSNSNSNNLDSNSNNSNSDSNLPSTSNNPPLVQPDDDDEAIGDETALDTGECFVKSPLDVVKEGIPTDLPQSQLGPIVDLVSNIHSRVGDKGDVANGPEEAKTVTDREELWGRELQKLQSEYQVSPTYPATEEEKEIAESVVKRLKEELAELESDSEYDSNNAPAASNNAPALAAPSNKDNAPSNDKVQGESSSSKRQRSPSEEPESSNSKRTRTK